MENRHLPILHRDISLRDLSASSESSLGGRAGGENGLTNQTTYYSRE